MMQNEHRATRQAGRQQQVRDLADSGVAYLLALLALDDGQLLQQGGLEENPDLLQGVRVTDDPLPTFRGRFTVLAPGMNAGQYVGTRYGLEDESARLNLNTLLAGQAKTAAGRSGTAGSTNRSGGSPNSNGQDSDGGVARSEGDTARSRLLALPGMDVHRADAILDYLDADDLPREYGAEQDYYGQLDPPRRPANGPIAHLDRLLEVRGVTPRLLYGVDTNRNDRIDPEEAALAGNPDTDEGIADRGWSAYLTVASGERVVDPDGEARIDVNSDALQDLSAELSRSFDTEEVNFIIALRQYGVQKENREPSRPSKNSAGQPKSSGPRPAADRSAPTGQTVTADRLTIDFNKTSSYQLTTLFDLVGARVEIPASGEGESPTMVESPWPDAASTYQSDWPDLEDRLQVGNRKQRTGRINIRLASRIVLQTLAALSDSDIESILSLRETEIDETTSPQRHASWLLARGIVTLEEMKKLVPRITCRGDVFRGQVVGYFESGRPQARYEITIDRIDPEPRLVGWRDLSSLGPAFSAELLGAEE